MGDLRSSRRIQERAAESLRGQSLTRGVESSKGGGRTNDGDDFVENEC
jgi:hypothetical protein